MIEMIVDSLRTATKNPMNTQHGTPYVALLKEKTGARYLPFFIGPVEANAIAIKLRGELFPRPLTHDLLLNAIDVFGGSIVSVVVSDLKNDTFYAKIVLNINGTQTLIDCRPSDGVALALASPKPVPIFVEDSVIQKAGVSLTPGEGGEFHT